MSKKFHIHDAAVNAANNNILFLRRKSWQFIDMYEFSMMINVDMMGYHHWNRKKLAAFPARAPNKWNR